MSRRGRRTKNTRTRRMAHATDHNDEETRAFNINEKNNKGDDHDDDDIVNIVESSSKTFLSYVYELEKKKESVRENALCSIIDILNSTGEEHESLLTNFATCLYRILDMIKRGSSAKVKQLASHALGLLSMTLCHSDKAQEIYRESLPTLSIALSKTSKMVDPWASITLLNSLAMVTFFCASNTDETESAMQVMWEFFHPRSKFDGPASGKQVPALIISAAITAWSFLLSSVDSWELHHKSWQGAISHFLYMLEADDESIYVAAGEALSVIFDHDSINKFFKEDEDHTHISSIIEIPVNYSERKSLIKHNILKQLDKLSIKAMNKTSLKQSFSNNAARADWDVLKYFKDDNFPPTSQRIYGHKLTLSSPSQMIQLKFLKNFIGEEEFGKHMVENELFHYLFQFTPIHKEDSDQELYESINIVCPTIVYEDQDSESLTKNKKKERNLRNSTISKPKSSVLNKKRMFAEERKGKMYCA